MSKPRRPAREVKSEIVDTPWGRAVSVDGGRLLYSLPTVDDMRRAKEKALDREPIEAPPLPTTLREASSTVRNAISGWHTPKEPGLYWARQRGTRNRGELRQVEQRGGILGVWGWHGGGAGSDYREFVPVGESSWEFYGPVEEPPR